MAIMERRDGALIFKPSKEEREGKSIKEENERLASVIRVLINEIDSLRSELTRISGDTPVNLYERDESTDELLREFTPDDQVSASPVDETVPDEDSESNVDVSDPTEVDTEDPVENDNTEVEDESIEDPQEESVVEDPIEDEPIEDPIEGPPIEDEPIEEDDPVDAPVEDDGEEDSTEG